MNSAAANLTAAAALMGVMTGAWGAATAAAGKAPHTLTTRETTELAATVCSTRHSVAHDRITAWRDKPGNSNNVQARVGCKAHATTAQYALHYAADCRRGAQWACGRSQTQLRTTLNSQPIDIVTNGFKPELAYSLVSKLAAYHTPKDEPLFHPKTTRCELAGGPSKDLLDINCDQQRFRLSYWCPQSSCPRIFSVDGYFVPANWKGL